MKATQYCIIFFVLLQIRTGSTYEDKTALHFAAEFGHVEAVKLLCREMEKEGAKLNPQDTVSPFQVL
jgi:hypothetical protein